MYTRLVSAPLWLGLSTASHKSFAESKKIQRVAAVESPKPGGSVPVQAEFFRAVFGAFENSFRFLELVRSPVYGFWWKRTWDASFEVRNCRLAFKTRRVASSSSSERTVRVDRDMRVKPASPPWCPSRPPCWQTTGLGWRADLLGERSQVINSRDWVPHLLASSCSFRIFSFSFQRFPYA